MPLPSGVTTEAFIYHYYQVVLMKHKVSISVDEATLLKVYELIRKGKFRNKSHAFEYAMGQVGKE